MHQVPRPQQTVATPTPIDRLNYAHPTFKVRRESVPNPDDDGRSTLYRLHITDRHSHTKFVLTDENHQQLLGFVDLLMEAMEDLGVNLCFLPESFEVGYAHLREPYKWIISLTDRMTNSTKVCVEHELPERAIRHFLRHHRVTDLVMPPIVAESQSGVVSAPALS
jgi:hypothetical protein